MGWIAGLISLITAILDRLPSRKESLLNEIQDTKNAIRILQKKNPPWTSTDSGKYYVLIDKLSKLEKRSANIG